MNTNKIIQIGNVYQSQFDNPTRGRVYSVNGLAPTINTCGGGQFLDVYHQTVYDDIVPTITTKIITSCLYFIYEDENRQTDGSRTDAE